MTLFYLTIPLMAVAVLLGVLPLALVVALERRRHLVTPAEVARAAALVRPEPEIESELVRRAEADAASVLEAAELELTGARAA